MRVKLVFQAGGHFEEARVGSDRGDVLVFHAEFSAGGCVKVEEGPRGVLSWQEPVVRLHDDEREAVQFGGIALKERLFGSFDVHFEEEWGVVGYGFGREEGSDGDHSDFGAIVCLGGSITILAFAWIGEVREAIVSGNAGLDQVDVKAGGISFQEREVVGGWLHGDDMGTGVAGDEPENTGTDVSSTIDDQGLLSCGDNLVVDTLDEHAMRANWHVVLGLGETLINDTGVGKVAAMDDGEVPASKGDVGDLLMSGDVGVSHVSCKVEQGTH